MDLLSRWAKFKKLLLYFYHPFRAVFMSMPWSSSLMVQKKFYDINCFHSSALKKTVLFSFQIEDLPFNGKCCLVIPNQLPIHYLVIAFGYFT